MLISPNEVMTTDTEITPDDIDFPWTDEEPDEEFDGPRYRRGARAVRLGRSARIVLAAVEGFLSIFGRGGPPTETVGDVVREGFRAAMIRLGLRRPRGGNA
ncbi:MAG: hypothetical protein RJB57_87, partial [Actinomycetota bacterium]